MTAFLVSMMLLVSQPVVNPAYFATNSPQCLAFSLSKGNPLPLMVHTKHPPCPWNSDDAALVEIGRFYSLYSYWNDERTTNLELAASHIDGTMLLPGEEFSFNQTVGERNERRGFKKAKVIIPGGYIEDYGGGICQTASTLHAAAVLAGLEITKRYSHRFRVHYMPPGLDATVDWGRKDLKIKNNTQFPVVFHLGRLEKGEFFVQIRAPMKTYRVKYKYELVKETPSDKVRFAVVEEVEDAVKYYGRPGLEIEKKLWVRDLRTKDIDVHDMGKDTYFPSPWKIRVTQLPGKKRFVKGLSVEEINKLLEGTRYTTESARFNDVVEQQGHYMPRVYVPSEKLHKFTRFARLRPIPDPFENAQLSMKDN